MRFAELKTVGGQTDETQIRNALAALAADDPRPNASMQAIAEAYGTSPGWTAMASAPFKSATKWSGTSYGEHGNWVIGAPDVLAAAASPVAVQAEQIGAKGLRVLLLGSSDRPVDAGDALVVLEQKVRPDARDTLEYFAEQQVSVKVISGDNAVSVGAVARSLGLHGETMDARELPTEPEALADTLQEYTNFGRVRPDQKRSMVHALQSRGHTVAMTGDGVNDVLALKDADIGVAFNPPDEPALLEFGKLTSPMMVRQRRLPVGRPDRVAGQQVRHTALRGR